MRLKHISGLEIAPLMMPLRDEPYMFADLPRNEYEGLPPVEVFEG